MSEFEKFWRKNFADACPAGFLLRTRFMERWIRFHALPESKRYATSDGERDIILHRADALATAVLGSNDCWIVASYPAESWEPDSEIETVRQRFGLEEAFTWCDYKEDESDQFEWRTCANRTQWVKGRFNELVQTIADDKSHGPSGYHREQRHICALRWWLRYYPTR